MEKRAGNTEKISVSVNRDDLAILRRRAKRLHGGNVSAVFAEIIARAKQQEGLEELLEWLGGAPPMTDERIREVDDELLGRAAPSPTRPARRPAKSSRRTS